MRIEKILERLKNLPQYEVTDDVYTLPGRELVEFYKVHVVRYSDLIDALLEVINNVKMADGAQTGANH